MLPSYIKVNLIRIQERFEKSDREAGKFLKHMENKRKEENVTIPPKRTPFEMLASEVRLTYKNLSQTIQAYKMEEAKEKERNKQKAGKLAKIYERRGRTKEEKKQEMEAVRKYYGNCKQISKEFGIPYSTVKKYVATGEIPEVLLNSLTYRMETEKMLRDEVKAQKGMR